MHVYGGYRITPQWAIELGYANMGNVTASNGVSTVLVKGNRFDVAATYKYGLPGTPWAGFAKVGLSKPITTQKLETAGAISTTVSRNRVRMLVGAGVDYQLNKQVTLRAEIDAVQVEVNGGFKGIATSLEVGALTVF